MLCFSLRNNIVCYYWLLFFDKPIFLLLTHTHTLTRTAQRMCISKNRLGTEHCLSEDGFFHSPNDRQASMWAHRFPVLQVQGINWSKTGRLCVRAYPKENSTGRACFLCLNKVVLTVGQTLFVKGVLSDTWGLEGEVFIWWQENKL